MNQNIFITKLESISYEFFGEVLTEARQLGGGGNSRVYKIVCGGKKYIVKFYFEHFKNKCNRLENEFMALRFLWGNGIRYIPQPLHINKSHGCLILEYINGKKISSAEVSESDIEHLVQFIISLRKLKEIKGSELIPPAAEAFFSIFEVVKNLNKRLSMLQECSKDFPNLRDFLDNNYVFFLRDVIEKSRYLAKKSGIDWKEKLERRYRTLSPSDFGFHNSLKLNNHKIVYLDFEYFGWDDPAKMISDFLLHPGTDLDEKWKQKFIKTIYSNFEQDESLIDRVKIVYPLYGMKWCLILLNEFLSYHLQRREFASKSIISDKIHDQQLMKAEKLLQTVKDHYQHFPYS